MDKRSKEALRRYKKSRQQARSSSDSSSSDSDSSGSSSYSSSDSDRHRKKKARQATATSSRRSSSSSADERRKRQKREHCQKKLEAKRNHLKRKLKEAKLKKRAAAAAAALSGHSHRALSPATQAKLKKLAERRHQRAASKERREREKHRVAGREREREHHRVSRSPTKITKIRIHQDVKRQKSPPRVHHQLMSREKIIIQTRTRDRTPSVERERQRHEHKLRHDELTRERERRERERERAEREAARDKERAEALARCQERQRERERLAREKMRREEEEKKYGSGLSVERSDRLLPRPADREIAIAAARGYNSRERSLEAVDRTRHIGKRDIVDVYDRERDYLEVERRGIIDREDIRRERDYLTNRRRDLSPVGEHYSGRLRDTRELYPEEERERAYNRSYVEEARHTRDREAWIDPREVRERELHDIRDPRDFREIEHEIIYPDERERIVRNRERALATREDWKNDWETNREREWDTTAPMARGGFVGGPKRGGVSGANISGPPKIPPREHRAPSEPDWDADEVPKSGNATGSKSEATNIIDAPAFGGNIGQRDGWIEHDQHDMAPQREKPLPSARPENSERRWQNDWREGEEGGVPRIGGNAPMQLHHHRSERGGRGFRRGGIGGLEHTERNPQGFRQHPPPLMTLPVQPPQAGYHAVNPRFPNKRNMTYTNPNLIKKQQAALAAAKAAAQASAVAAASTAVAAVKAAALSAANATTNPSILGQVSGASRLQQSLMSTGEKPEAGEIVPSNEKSITKAEVESTTKPTDTTTTAMCTAVDEKAGGELSEISDSDDDILNKADKKSKAETDEATEDSIGKANTVTEHNDVIVINEDVPTTEDRVDDDEMLDFEEISDGELEEDARNKGVGDALGVDWASLIAETKLQAENTVPIVSEQPTTAKQKWQPHRVILDIGISMRMAGEEYGKRLLSEAKQKLNEELGQIHIKSDIKEETISTIDEDSQMAMDTDENTNDIDGKNIKSKTSQKSLEELNETTINVDRLHPIACIQVAERLRSLERCKLIANACGTNSRALSARQDLKLRRQLCGLPARECDFPRPLPAASEKIKAMALAAFQRTLEVK